MRMVDHCYGEQVRTARKPHRCTGYTCGRIIEPGEAHVECVEFPGGESGYADAAGRPVRMRVCGVCDPDRLARNRALS